MWYVGLVFLFLMATHCMVFRISIPLSNDSLHVSIYFFGYFVSLDFRAFAWVLVMFAADSSETLNILAPGTEEKPANAEKLKEQSLSAKDEKMFPTDGHNVSAARPSRDTIGRPGPLGAVRDCNNVYATDVYAPQAQAYYGGFENITTGGWDGYSHYVNAEGMEIGYQGIYENPSPLFHAGYGYPQMPYGSYSTVTPPLPLAELSMPASMDHHGAFRSDALNSNGILFGPRPSYTFPYGSFDWSKASEGQRSLTQLSSPAASRQPIGTVGSFGHSVTPFASGMRPSYGSGSTTNSNNRVYAHNGAYQQGANFGGSLSGFGMSDRSWVAVDKGGQRGRGSGSFCSCNGTLDILSEQNKGPRALKTKNSKPEQNYSVNSKNGVFPKADGEIYNRPDFVTEYGDAKFFVIKSYSEDNVHKSIKYGVWASTSSGNRKLDAAYRESREKEGACQVFLLFSVNASAQFCGVAEMVGPVDFDKSVDYWQQDKWTGQFPVKWHIIKDVPNSEFRHIIIEHNDNKPVTNSRDTQEVGLEQGLEILKIFKNYETDMSILDDFDFYEDRQKAMQDRKSRQQQASLVSVTAGTGNEHRSPVPLSDDYVKHISKSFANTVRLEDCSKIGPTIRNTGSTGATAPTGATTQDAANVVTPAPLQSI